MGFAKALALVMSLGIMLPGIAHAEEVVYRMSKATHDNLLASGLAWWHFWGQPDQTQNPEDYLIEKASWGRLKSLKDAGITKEIIN